MTRTTTDSGVTSALPAANSTRGAVVPTTRSRTWARRDAILGATLTAATAGGYEAVQIRVVADQVGSAVGTLYRYFISRLGRTCWCQP